MSLTGGNNEISLGVLGNFKARVIHRGGLGTVASCGDDGSQWHEKPKLDAWVDTKIRLNHWNVVVESALRQDKLQVEGCRVTALNFNLDGRINDRLVPRARSLVKDVQDDVNRKLASLDFRSKAERAWTKVQEPIAIAENFWIVVRPQTVALVPLAISGTTVTSGVTLTAMPIVTFGAKPPATQTPLPEPVNAPPAQGFRIQMALEATYQGLTNHLRGPDGVVGKVFPLAGNLNFVVKDARIYGFGDRAIMQVDLGGWKTGSVFFQAKPALDVQSSELVAADFDYTIQSKDIFVKLVEGFPGFHEAFRAAISQHFRYRFASDLANLRAQIQAGLNKDLGDIRLQGNLNQIRPLGVLARKDRFVGYALLEGSLAVIPK